MLQGLRIFCDPSISYHAGIMSQVWISPMRIYYGKSWGFILICLQATQKAQPAISCCVPGCTTPFKNSDRFASDRKGFVREEEGFMFGMCVKVNAKPQFGGFYVTCNGAKCKGSSRNRRKSEAKRDVGVSILIIFP